MSGPEPRPRPEPKGPTCVHPDFAAIVEVNRHYQADPPDESAMPDGFSADVRISCVACGEPMVFFGAGLAMGLTRDRPAIDPAGTELRCPIRPQSSDPHMGLGLAGFQARLQENDPSGLN